MTVSTAQPKVHSDHGSAGRGMQPEKSPWKRIATILCCQLIAILFVESVLFVAGLGEEDIYKLDPERGFRHMTNKRVTWRSEGYAVSYFDGDGMREPGLTVAKPAGSYRIALLGDSMAEGLQVPIEETFGQILSKSLTSSTRKPTQVLNFSTSGYSTAQEFIQLKQQVWKYQPDMVILCYNSRDIFENWSPPDEVLTNVRPFALHLPGNKLIVESAPVLKWMKSPRARFLLATSWLRENSRIVGILSALELEWSQHNPYYRAFSNVFTHPKRALKELKIALSKPLAGPSFDIKFFEDAPTLSNAKPVDALAVPAPVSPEKIAISLNSAAPNVVLEKNPLLNKSGTKEKEDVASLNSAAPNAVLEKNALLEKAEKKERAVFDGGHPLPKAGTQLSLPDGQLMYKRVITKTFDSLMKEMKTMSAAHGAKFLVISMPNRASLIPNSGLESKFCDIDYAGELAIVSRLCLDNAIPFLNPQQRASALSLPEKAALFYSVHLTPAGHRFIAESVHKDIHAMTR